MDFGHDRKIEIVDTDVLISGISCRAGSTSIGKGEGSDRVRTEADRNVSIARAGARIDDAAKSIDHLIQSRTGEGITGRSGNGGRDLSNTISR